MSNTKTKWTALNNPGSPGSFTIQKNGTDFIIKGICYSPVPINNDTNLDPAVGDYFWDTYKTSGTTIYNWYSLWGNGSLGNGNYARNDIETIAGLGANAIRVYSMIAYQMKSNGTLPSDPSKGNHFTHKTFLDKCLDNNISVLVDIPMPGAAFKAFNQWPTNGQNFWETVLDQTTKDIGNHPAVIGFNIMNEQDQDLAAFPNGGTGTSDTNTDYFYGQSVKYANIVKKNAPDKLVGWALHDVPQLLYFANKNKPTTGGSKTYLELLSEVFDFWGINTYQYQNLDSIFGNISIDNGLTYNQLPDNCKKPVIFTEFGWPATGHNPDTVSGQIYSDKATETKTAAVVSSMYDQAYNQSSNNFMFAGAFYFEFADEWWKTTAPAAWNGGVVNTGFPNGYQDEEGFGLFSIARAGGRKDDSNNWANNGPVLPQDTYIPRMPIINALKKVYATSKKEITEVL